MKYNKPLKSKTALVPFLKPIGPMMTRAEANQVMFTVAGDRMVIQAPRATIRKIAERLTLLGAAADVKSPYGPSVERTEGEAR